MPQRPPAEPHTGPPAEPHTGLGLVLFCQKAWRRTPMAHTITDCPGHGGSRVWLRVFHPVTREEVTPTARDGDNSDSLPAPRQSSGVRCPGLWWMVVGGTPLPQRDGHPSPPREGRATQGAASRYIVLYHMQCLIHHKQGVSHIHSSGLQAASRMTLTHTGPARTTSVINNICPA